MGDIVVTQLMVGGTERGEKDIECQDFAFLFFLFLDSQGLNLTTIGHTHTRKRANQTNRKAHKN